MSIHMPAQSKVSLAISDFMEETKGLKPNLLILGFCDRIDLKKELGECKHEKQRFDLTEYAGMKIIELAEDDAKKLMPQGEGIVVAYCLPEL